MDRVLQHVADGSDLDDLAEVHHRDPVGDKADRGDVVRDEEIGEPALLLERDQPIQDLGLDRDVERTGGLVQDDQLRLDAERPREGEALPTAPRELVRVLVEAIGREPDGRKDRGDPFPKARPAQTLLGEERFPDDLPDPQTGVERSERVLEDHLDLAVPRAQGPSAEVGDVLAVEQDSTARRRIEPGDKPSEGRLPGPGFADEAERLPRPRDGDPVHGVDRPVGRPADHIAHGPGEREMLDKVARLEERGRGAHGSASASLEKKQLAELTRPRGNSSRVASAGPGSSWHTGWARGQRGANEHRRGQLREVRDRAREGRERSLVLVAVRD